MDLKKVNVEDNHKLNTKLNKNLSEKLIEWVEKQLDLPSITEYEALLFLNATDKDLEQAKKLVNDYYTYRTSNPDIFGNRNIFDNDMEIANSNSMFVPLPGVTEEGHRVLYCKMTNEDASEFNVIRALKLFAFSTDLWIQQKGISSGDIIIVDMHCYTIDHVKKFTEDSAKKLMTMLQQIFLGRLKGFLYINTALELNSTGNLVKFMQPHMTKKFHNILQFHPTMETVFKIFPKEMFPTELGGSAGTRKELQEKYWKVLINNADYFIEEEQTKRLKSGK